MIVSSMPLSQCPRTLTVEPQSATVSAEVEPNEDRDPYDAADEGTGGQLPGTYAAHVLRSALNITRSSPIAIGIAATFEALMETCLLMQSSHKLLTCAYLRDNRQMTAPEISRSHSLPGSIRSGRFRRSQPSRPRRIPP